MEDGNMFPGWEYDCQDLQGSVQLQHEPKSCMSQLPFAFGLVENERRECIVIPDDVANYAEECKLEHNEAGKSEEGSGSPWQRTKWTGKMVRLLVTLLSYIGEDPSTNCSGSRVKVSSLLRKVGKWKCVSKVMVERGYHVSPQQCEDKFNNLNKTYRRLNDLLGRGTSCKVVANPKLLDMIDVSELEKEDARKILTSKHLFFEEMCSYHNGNRLYLPHDPDLLGSLLFILKNEDNDELLDSSQPMLDGANQTLNAQGDTSEYNRGNSGFFAASAMLKQTNENEVAGLGNPFETLDFNQVWDAQPLQNVTHQNLSWDEADGSEKQWMAHLQNVTHQNLSCDEADGSEKQWMAHRVYQLEKRKLHLKSKVLNLEKKRMKWRRRIWKQDLELDKMRLGNKYLKLGNEYMAMQLERKRMDLDRV